MFLLVPSIRSTDNVRRFDRPASHLHDIIFCEGILMRDERLATVNNPSVPGLKAASTIYIGKWSVSILSALREKPHRHGELRRRLGQVSQRILTRTLRNLESAGLVARSVTRSRSVAVEYSLTPVGRTFIGPLTHICRWADRYHKELRATVRLLNIDGRQ